MTPGEPFHVSFRMVALLLLVVSLTACGGGGGGQSTTDSEKYFTGKQGVTASFTNFPASLYYYGPDDNAGNEFSFGVEMRNQGASFTRGGVYVSGFDPRLLVFQEIPIFADGGANACGLSLGTIGFGQIGGIFRCDGVTVAGNENYGSVRLDLNRAIEGFAEKYGKNWWIPSQFNFEYNDAGELFTVNWPAGTNVEYYQHGRLFIAVMGGLDFIINGGREFLLAGDTYEYPGGEYAYFIYNGKIVNWPPGLEETDQSFLLTTCYQYTTYASPIVCIDPEPYSENRKVCRPGGKSYGSGNGAPVAIASVQQENTPRKIIFHINVKNIGSGTVYDPAKLEKCSPYYPGRVTPEDINIVYLGDVRIGNYGLETRGGTGGIKCSPERIRLNPETGTGSTTCVYPIEFGFIKSAYQTPLTIELWYGYSEVQQRSVHIKRVI